MASITRYREQWNRYHLAYEKRATPILMRVFREWGNSINWDAMTETNYTAPLRLSIDEKLMFNAYLEIYTQIGLVHGRRVGRSINMQLKEFTFDAFSTSFKENLMRWLLGNGGSRITSVTRTYVELINNLIAVGLEEGKSLSVVTTEIQKLLKSRGFYRWQALRIARTETTTAANYSATQAGEVSGFVMEKVWISTLDSRTRKPPKSHFNHHNMNQVRVPEKSPFLVSGDLMQFPGAPTGQAGNVINCRCTVAIVPKRDRNGSLIRTL